MSSATILTIRYGSATWTSANNIGPGVESSISMKLRTRPYADDDGIDYEKMAKDFLLEINTLGVKRIPSLLKGLKIEEHDQWVRDKPLEEATVPEEDQQK